MIANFVGRVTVHQRDDKWLHITENVAFRQLNATYIKSSACNP
jgi:hypothetical protein